MGIYIVCFSKAVQGPLAFRRDSMMSWVGDLLETSVVYQSPLPVESCVSVPDSPQQYASHYLPHFSK